MPTECSAESFDFGAVEGRCVEAAFDAGLVTSDAGALLLGTSDILNGSSTRSRPWSVNGFSGSRWATRISTITTSCGTIR